MNKTLFSILACVLLWLPASGLAAETCGCDVRTQELADFDQALVSAHPEAVTRRHTPWGMPVSDHSALSLKVLYQRHWITGYDKVLRMPVWAAYKLTDGDVSKRLKRTQCFRPDPRLNIALGRTLCASFRGSGFDRGHMIASADMTRAKQAMVNTYVFSNIAPQYPGFNRSIWRKLEAHIRAQARTHGDIYVITGAIFDRDHDGLPDPVDIALRLESPSAALAPAPAIATHFYKVLARRVGAGLEITAWLLAHKNVYVQSRDMKRVLDDAQVSIDLIEKMSGFELFPDLHAAPEQALAR